MDTLLFLLMFAGAWLVVGWYIHNELRKTPGTAGLLAIRNEAALGRDGAASYRLRQRRTPTRFSNLPNAETSARYRTAGEGASYRAVDRQAYAERGAAYKVKTRNAESA